MAPSPRLDRADWLQLGAFCAIGAALGYGLLRLLLHYAFEPVLIEESSLRINARVRMVEQVLRLEPMVSLPEGVQVETKAQPEALRQPTPFTRKLERALMSRYGLRRQVLEDRPPLADPLGGYWIRLNVPAGRTPLWLYQPERLTGSGVWFLPLLGSLSLLTGVLVGTIAFLNLRVERAIVRVLRGLPDTAAPPLPLLPERGIAPLRLLSLRINRLLERVNAAAADRRALLRGLTHDLGGPQARLLLQVETLVGHLEGRQAQTTAKAIESDLLQLRHITDQLSLLADQDLPSAHPEQVALDDLCARVSASYPGDQLQLELPRLLVQLDVVGLERSLANLIDNALEYGRPPVRIQAWRQGQTLVIQIDDHGHGLPTPTLLTRAQRAPASDRERSRHRGLGLAIVERYCREQGGQLHLGRAPGGGLRARLKLNPTPANPLFVH